MGFNWTERVYKAFGPVEGVDKEEMSILVAIAHCTNDVTNAGFPSTATLGRMTHISRATIFNRLNTLEAKGYLSYTPGGFRDGRQYANEYVIKFPADPSQSVARTPSVRGADPSGLYDGRGVVSATDPNETIKYKSKENSLRGSSPSGAFQLMGVGVPGVLERPKPTPTGKLMDFCRTSSPFDRQKLMCAALAKGRSAIEAMLARLKKTQAGKGLSSSQRLELVFKEIARLPDVEG